MPTKSFLSLFSNPIFIAGTMSLIIAQILKALLTMLKRKKLQAKDIAFIMLWKTGGMPSSHSALVAALTSSIAIVEGFDSLFVLSFFLGLIVIRDALGVRRSAGLQSRALNVLGKQVSERLGLHFSPVKEIHGHKWQEVAVGMILGLLVSFITCWPFIFTA